MIRHAFRVAAICFAASISLAQGATDIVVTTTANNTNADGQCSLREAIFAAGDQETFVDCVVGGGGGPYRVVLQAGATYTVAPQFYSHGGLLGTSFGYLSGYYKVNEYGYATRIAANIELVGNGATIQRDPSSPKFRLFYVSYGNVKISDVTLKGGDIRGDAKQDFGGAIYVDFGQLSMDRVTFEGNNASQGGAVFVGYGSTVNVLGSTFVRNGGLGALHQQGDSPLNVANSTFSNVVDFAMAFGESSSTGSLTHNTFGGLFYAKHKGSIVARGNVFTQCSVDNDGATQGSYNIGPGTCGLTAAGLVDPMQPAEDNGGPGETMGFVVPSQLQDVDATCTFVSTGVNPLFTNGARVTTDQRGVSRGSSGPCDTGAYEEGLVQMNAALLPAHQAMAYSSPLTGTGGTGPYTFSLVDGPDWLSVTNVGPNFSITGMVPPSGHGTTVPIVLRTEDATGLAGFATYSFAIAPGLPNAPTLTSADFDEIAGTMTVNFTPPADDGGSAITSYVVRCSTPFQSAPSLTSPIVFTVPTGINANCAVVAININGSGPASTNTFGMSSGNAIVTSLTLAAPAIIAPNLRAPFNITFNKPVIQLSADDFQVVATGTLTGNTIIDVTGSGTSYQVGVNTGTGGFGSLTLNFVDIDSVYDSSLVPVGGAGFGNGDFPGPTYTVAIPPSAPTITGLFALDSEIVVQYTAATDNGLPILGYESTCNPGGSTSARSLPYVLEVRVPVVNDVTYTCTVRAYNDAGAGTPSAPMVLAVPAVVVTNLRAASLNPAAPGSDVTYSLTFDHDVTGVDITDFFLTTTGLTGAYIKGVIGAGSSYTVKVNTGTGVGTLRLDMVDDDTIRDATAPLYGTGTGPGSNGEVFIVNNLPSAPDILQVIPGDSQAAVAFSPPISDGGLPILEYEATCVPPPPAVARTARAPSSPVIVPIINGLNYLCYVSAVNSAGTGLPSDVLPVSNLLTIVAGITRASADPAYGATVDYTVAFTNPVTGVDLSDFALATTGTIAGASIVGLTGSGATYTVTVDRGTGTGTLRLDLVFDGSINDASAPVAILGGIFNGETYTILSAPSVTSITAVGSTTTAAATVQYTVTFSGPVSGVDTSDFTLTNGGTIAGASVSTVTGGPQAYTVTVNTGTGSGTIRLDLVDDDSITDGTPLGGPGAGNGNAQGAVFTLDRGAPVVQSLAIVGGTPAGPVASGTVITYEVTFTKAITGIDATDFTATLTGSAAALPGGVTGSGAVYQIPYAVSGSGTVRINLADDDSIADTLGNTLGGAGVGNGGFTSGPTVTVDGTPPVVNSIVRTAAAATVTAGASVGFTVTFSKAVTGVDTADFTLVPTGTAAGSITGVTGSGTTYTVNVLTSAAGGTLRLDVIDNDSIVDGVLNALGGTGAGNGNFTAGQDYTVVAPDRVFTGTPPGGSGPITVTFTGGGPACTFNSAQFIPATGPGAPPSPPRGQVFQHGLFDFTLGGCTAGSTVTMTITYPTAIRAGTAYWKYGRTPTSPVTPVWYTIPSTIAGNVMTISIADGGLGDDDLAANGSIVDPGGPAALPGPPVVEVPTLSQWMLALLAGLMLLAAVGFRRKGL